MDIKQIIRRTTPIAMTALTICGIGGTGYLTARATVKAVRTADQMPAPSKREVAKAVWKYYIPPAATALFTTACVIGSHILNRREQALLVAGQASIAKAFNKYRAKLTELYGEEPGRTVEEALTAEKCKDVPLIAPSLTGDTSLDPDIPVVDTELTFRETMTGRTFRSTLRKVIEAEYHLNRNFVLGGCACFGEYLEFLGLEHDDEDDDIGWSIEDEFYWIDFDNRVNERDGVIDIIPMFPPEQNYLAN